MTYSHALSLAASRRHASAMLCVLLACVLSVPGTSVRGQQLESYIQQKKSEKQEPNSFLSNDGTKQLDQLGTYYRKAFASQSGQRGFQFGGDLSNAGNTAGGAAKTPSLIALDGAVDPDAYRVGPMDAFDVSIWGDIPASFVAYVTSEGTMIVPTVGEIAVRDMTLRQAKAAVVAQIRRKYTKAEASMTLLSPRVFTVHVTGVVAAPGSYEVTAIDRADRAIAIANSISPARDAEKRTAQPASGQERIVSYSAPPPEPEPLPSLRGATIFRGGEVLSVDLLRYYATGDLRFNPRLQDGDVLHVPPEALEGNSVGVYGGVRLPGSFEFHSGDSLSLLLRIAQGVKNTAILDSIQIARFSEDGVSWSLLTFDGTRVLDRSVDAALQPGDRVFVQERRRVRAGYTVTIKGEVQTAGSFPISEYGSTLTEVIARAGGFTPQASVAEVLILRKNPNLDLDPIRKVPDFERLEEQRLSDMDHEQRQYFAYEAAIRRNTVALDARRLFIDRDAAAEVTLRDGDEIIVPTSGNSVFVFGQVRNPGHVTYVAGMDDEYYIARAGGFAENAEDGDTRVIKAGSRDWVDPDDTRIIAGDAVFVPRENERDFAFYFTAARDFLTVAVSVVTIYLLMQQR